MSDRQIIVDSCKNGDQPCPMFDTEMVGCQLANVLGIGEEVSCYQAAYDHAKEEHNEWVRQKYKARNRGQKEPELPDNPIPFPENCPLKAGPYTGPWTIKLIYPDG